MTRPVGQVVFRALGGVMLLLSLQSASASALEWHTGAGHRCADLPVPTAGRTGFSLAPPAQTGVVFTNRLADSRSITNQIFLNGSGVAAGDVDGDGLCDLFFGGIDGPSALYRNLGRWQFEDITASAGVACADQSSTGVALVDVDGDGDVDLVVNGLGRGARLFLNDGRAHFVEATEPAGLGGRMGSSSLALADIDGDGDLDLYVANYRMSTLRDEPNTRFSIATAGGKFELLRVNDRPVSSPDLVGRFSVDPVTGVLEHGEPDILYRNAGQGRFVPVSWSGGSFLDEDGRPSKVPYDWSLSAMFRDLNHDGAPDLIVCADFHSEDRFWINDGQGRFRALRRLAVRQTSLFSMGVDVADIDRDGNDDLFVADMLSRRHGLRQVQLGFFNPLLRWIGQLESRPQYSRNVLFWNRGDGTYAEIAQMSGLEASDWTWCPVFLDVDLDGFEDLLTITGHARDAQNIDTARQIDQAIRARAMSLSEQLSLRMQFPRLDTPNYAFRNQGNLTFVESGDAWGFNSREISQGIAVADLDNDGDLDLAINCLGASPLLYRNETSAPRVAVRLRGTPPNTHGIGARIILEGGPVASQSQEIIAGGRYQSSDAPMRTFAAAPAGGELRLVVRWRSGRESSVGAVQANRVYEIDEAGARRVTHPPPAQVTSLLAGMGNALGHQHHDDAFDDFARQPLLPHQLSELGPGLAWSDLDGDGWEDLVVGCGTEGMLGVFLNQKDGRLAPATNRAWQARAERDQTTILGWRGSEGQPELLIGSSSYEDGLTNRPSVIRLNLGDGSSSGLLAGVSCSVGPLALADVDGDGDLDLFVGGRVCPRRYPVPVSSFLLRNEGGMLCLDVPASESLSRLGLVSSALWTDLDANGMAELVVACENGSLQVLRFQQGVFTNLTAGLGLATFCGWWNSVGSGDFDGDGRLDLVAGNWGRNTRYQSYLSNPMRLYYGDLNDDEVVEVVQACFAPELGRMVPWHDWDRLALGFPAVRQRFASYAAYGKAGIEEILGTAIKQMQQIDLTTFDSMVFLNRGDRFEARPLPVAAQVSPVFGLGVVDLDGDGCEDLVLAQNFFGVSPEMSRHDAGRGLWLKGDGRGNFTPMSAAESGIELYGEGRGLALCDFDHDGRADLAVAQNRGATQLYHNRGAKPGLRVQLRGPRLNPDGIGAVVRVRYPKAHFGAAREVHAGGGYWSQDSPVVILGLEAEPEGLLVRWPGGNTQEVRLAPGQRAVDVLASESARAATHGIGGGRLLQMRTR